jgi:predicted unusual protein kinase regulating ubiquinone biosynthesis (AarF/ABC1/UbiB family)
MDEKKPVKKQKPAPELSRIKSSTFSRGLSLAKLTFQAGASLAQHGISSALKNKEEKEENWKKHLQSQASLISSELGELKGSLMKAGQMLSVYGEHFLPPEANSLLKSLQSDSIPLSWEAIEPTLKKQMAPEQLNQLEIEKTALASASMGQVHRARIKATGETIALKIQYPNVDKAIDSDLKAIRTLLTTMKLLPRDLNLDPVFDEVRTMLHQEIDYELEARLTEEFRKRLESDSRFIIPRVFREFSGPRILATSFERGIRVDDPLIQSLPQERRNRLAANFLDLYFKEIFEWGVVQTDPHAGNYRIRIDPQGHDQLVLFDFGATREYSPEFMIPYRQMVKGSLLNDRELLNRSALKLKFIADEDSAELRKLFEEFCFESVEPFLEHSDPRNVHQQVAADGTYDWKKTDLPKRISSKAFAIIRNHKWRSPPREILFLDRKTGGVFVFLSILHARIRGRDLMMKYIDKVPTST